MERWPVVTLITLYLGLDFSGLCSFGQSDEAHLCSHGETNRMGTWYVVSSYLVLANAIAEEGQSGRCKTKIGLLRQQIKSPPHTHY